MQNTLVRLSFGRLALSGTLLLLAAFCPASRAQETGKRIALIIGNDAYSISPLKNAVNDARLMDRALKSAGFQNILLENAKKADMDRAIGEFLDKLGPDDTALFYFAGHGVQIENENFLVPVDFAPVASISAAKFACMSVAQVFDELKHKRARCNIVILDACRSNPVAEKYSLAAGLAKPQDAPNETFVAFSTGPGQTATDNPDGRNSWFTEALGDYVEQPTLTIELNDVLTRVKKRVSDATEHRQTPWTTSSLTHRFYFHPPAAGDTEQDSTLIEKWRTDALAREQREEWAEAIDLTNQVLRKKPAGQETALQRKLAYLTARRDAQVRFDAGDYAAAAGGEEQALKLDPFAPGAALEGADSYLLEDRLPEAVALLHAIRARGTPEAVQTAERMLKELAAASPEAASEMQSPAPQPPSLAEMFADTHFGMPDWDAGKRHVDATAIDLTRLTKDLKMEVPMPALLALTAPGGPAAPDAAPPTAGAPETAAAEPSPSPINNAIFHVEVVPTGDSRNLHLRQTGQPEEFGYVQFDGPDRVTPVVFEGKQVVLPATLRLPTGKYEVRTVAEGKVLSRQDVEVTPATTQTYTVKKP